MSADLSTRCDGCGEKWEVPPTLGVACPTCGAAQHRPCKQLRPSEHRLNAGFAGLHPWGHVEREKLAMDIGLIKLCPATRKRAAAQLELGAEV